MRKKEKNSPNETAKAITKLYFPFTTKIDRAPSVTGGDKFKKKSLPQDTSGLQKNNAVIIYFKKNYANLKTKKLLQRFASG